MNIVEAEPPKTENPVVKEIVENTVAEADISENTVVEAQISENVVPKPVSWLAYEDFIFRAEGQLE